MTEVDLVRPIAGASGFGERAVAAVREVPKLTNRCDDELPVQQHLDRFWFKYLTDLEWKCYTAALRQEKQRAASDTGWPQREWADLQKVTDEAIRSALAEGFDKVQKRLREKVLLAFATGALKVIAVRVAMP